MPLIKRNDSKAVAHVLTEKEKDLIREGKQEGKTKDQLIERARSTFNNDRQDAKREAAIRMIVNLFATAK